MSVIETSAYLGTNADITIFGCATLGMDKANTKFSNDIIAELCELFRNARCREKFANELLQKRDKVWF